MNHVQFFWFTLWLTFHSVLCSAVKLLHCFPTLFILHVSKQQGYNNKLKKHYRDPQRCLSS